MSNSGSIVWPVAFRGGERKGGRERERERGRERGRERERESARDLEHVNMFGRPHQLTFDAQVDF